VQGNRTIDTDLYFARSIIRQLSGTFFKVGKEILNKEAKLFLDRYS